MSEISTTHTGAVAHVRIERPHKRNAISDSVILATARAADATLWTQDADFATVPGVRYVAKKSG